MTVYPAYIWRGHQRIKKSKPYAWRFILHIYEGGHQGIKKSKPYAWRFILHIYEGGHKGIKKSSDHVHDGLSCIFMKGVMFL